MCPDLLRHEDWDRFPKTATAPRRIRMRVPADMMDLRRGCWISTGKGVTAVAGTTKSTRTGDGDTRNMILSCDAKEGDTVGHLVTAPTDLHPAFLQSSGARHPVVSVKRFPETVVGGSRPPAGNGSRTGKRRAGSICAPRVQAVDIFSAQPMPDGIHEIANAFCHRIGRLIQVDHETFKGEIEVEIAQHRLALRPDLTPVFTRRRERCLVLFKQHHGAGFHERMRVIRAVIGTYRELS